jgi:putative ATP-dependent endonuclease of OLD family
MSNILVDTVRICGFRGIKNLEISLPRVTVLIGTNNSGKTSLLKALQLALGDYSRYVSEEDFYIGSDDKRASEIKVDVRFVAADENGNRVGTFDESWQTEFGDKIRAEANGNQFVAIRTCVKPNEIKGGFECSRYPMQTWPEFAVWQDEKIKEKDKINRIISTPFISIEAQRDIHYELKDKSSFAGRVLSGVEYGKEDIIEIERLIQELNINAINKSSALKSFKTQLEKLNQSFQGAGNVEITPFPKKIRDLSKHFSVHFGEGASNTFSMEYHGMGTRSWASMLTVKAFVEAQVEKHKAEVEPFFPILAAEEPEAHLHPNAQRTLYGQLAESEGQVIVSTHSPYFAAMADIRDIRSMRNDSEGMSVQNIPQSISSEDRKILAREIISKKGEILFARALILAEGITEEQVIPAICDLYTNKSLFALGISCVSVSGKNYAPFVKLACSLGIPTYIISDNDGSTKTEIESQLKKIRDEGYKIDADIL